MQRIYFDNAATTPIDPQVVEAMMPFLTEKFGNPSSTHAYGRETKMAIEKSRKTIAQGMGCKPGEIIFTSGGTESSNMALVAAIRDLGVKHIITSRIEHHATLHTVLFFEQIGWCTVSYVNTTELGFLDLVHLEELLGAQTTPCLLSLMHANNEIGNLLDITTVSKLARKYKAWLHTDAVQTVAHFPIDVTALDIDFLSASAHKFHGPKGVGFLYTNPNIQIKPLLHGGGQERLMRAGTENVASIIGLSKAFELALERMDSDQKAIRALKQKLYDALKSLPGVSLNGVMDERSLYTVLNMAFPKNEQTEVLSMNLDIAGICVSGGSACSSGAEGGSHVIRAAFANKTCVPIRFSLSRLNTETEVEEVVSKISSLLLVNNK
jgi:cysteine desulfurase